MYVYSSKGLSPAHQQRDQKTNVLSVRPPHQRNLKPEVLHSRLRQFSLLAAPRCKEAGTLGWPALPRARWKPEEEGKRGLPPALTAVAAAAAHRRRPPPPPTLHNAMLFTARHTSFAHCRTACTQGCQSRRSGAPVSPRDMSTLCV